MNRFVLFIAFEPKVWDDASTEQRQAWMDDHARFDDFVAEHGRRISTAPLADVAAARTLRHVRGQRLVTDGPFAETAETIGGYYDVELPDVDVALEAAGLLPSGYSIEVRPTIVPYEDRVQS